MNHKSPTFCKEKPTSGVTGAQEQLRASDTISTHVPRFCRNVYFLHGSYISPDPKPHENVIQLASQCECTVQPREPTNRAFRKAMAKLSPTENKRQRLWSDLVTWYSSLKFTFEDDRLPAIAGLASKPAESFKSAYLFGLWKADLPLSLLWAVNLNATSPVQKNSIPSSSGL